MLSWIGMLLLVCMCSGRDYKFKTIVDGIEFRRYNDNSYPEIICVSTTLDDHIVSPNTIRIHEKKLDVVDCPLPNKSYSESLSALNVDVTIIERLGIVEAITQGTNMQTFTEMHFKDLPNLKNLSIFTKWKDVNKLNTLTLDYLNPLLNLTEFYTHYMDNVSLPESNSLKKVHITGGTLYNKLGGCHILEDLTVESVIIINFNKDLIAHCPRLINFSIIDIDMTEDRLREILSEANQLQDLTVRSCRLSSMDQLNLTNLVNLKRVDFRYNPFETIGSLSYWPKLEEIKISKANEESFRSILHKHKDLSSLSLTGAYDFNACENNTSIEEEHGGRITKHSKLQRLSIEVFLRDLCFDQLEALEFLKAELWTKVLKFDGLPVSRAPLLIVDLFWISEEKSIQFTKEDYTKLRNESYYFDKINSTKQFTRGAIEIHTRGIDVRINCDCEHGWFSRALHDDPRLKFKSNILCQDKNNTKLLHAPATWMECVKWQCEGNCTCRRYWSNNATDIDCHGRRLETIPHIAGLRVLLAPNNEIKTFNADDLPATLTLLDLTNNRISQIDGSVAMALFNVSDRRLRLAGNPIVCNCDNREFMKVLILYHDQVQDYEDVRCAEDGRLLADVDLDSICVSSSHLNIITGIVATGVLIALASLAFTVYYRYKRELRVFLYARGWCLWYVREEELDADRPYDAFVSFSHGDEDYVIQELVPGLENAPQAYKICVHYRDWVPGEFIPLQISRSIEQSRRTIIVMSQNYMASIWGLLEFRTAHEDTLNSRRPRIIVILLEDVMNGTNLDAQVRTYLKNNTYVKKKDPWFWEKLYYAMPHREESVQNIERNSEQALDPMPAN